jgi:RNA polymerase sigma-70 factor, ECF subfamily
LNHVNQLAGDVAQRVARESYGKLIAILARRTRDVASAEDFLAEAFASALETWPRTGVPNNPEAWLIAVAKRKHLDGLRQSQIRAESASHLQLLREEIEDMGLHQNNIPDDRLALMFACAHPAIDTDIRSPLMLQTVLGMTAEQIAAAFLVAPATMGQRLARAKAKIKLAGIPFRVPDQHELSERLDAVLDAIYAMFNQGWTSFDAEENNLVEDAMWFSSLAVELQPDQPETLGLSSLMLFLHSRLRARRNAEGVFVPLADQDVTLWDDEKIDLAEFLLRKASEMNSIGRFQLEAAIQSAHVARRFTLVTDWHAINQFYAILFQLTGSPVVKLNWAYAIGEDSGWEVGLAALPKIEEFPELTNYQPYFAVRAALLEKCGQVLAAQQDYDKAIALEHDSEVRAFLAHKRDKLSLSTLQ